jgi:hypothetical protein
LKVIIAGSRSITNQDLVFRAIRNSGFEITEVVCGEAAGVDHLGKVWAEMMGIPAKSFPADWDDLKAPGAVIRKTKWGKSYNAMAGPARNQKMADYADALICVHGNTSGSLDMIRWAKAKGLKVFEVKI